MPSLVSVLEPTLQATGCQPPHLALARGEGPSRGQRNPALCRNDLASVPIHREPHWNVTVLVPSELAIMVEVIGCEPFLNTRWQSVMLAPAPGPSDTYNSSWD